MTKPAYSIAVVNAADLGGREIIGALHERGFPVASIRAWGPREMQGEDVDFGGQTLTVEALEDGMAPADLAFFVGDPETASEQAQAVIATGGVVIDCSGHFALEDDVPLVVPECNAARLADFNARHIIASPDPVAVALSVVLAPLHAEAGVRRLVATALEGVSIAGTAGIDELSHQTVEVLNGRSVEPQVFPARVCFNVLPAVGEVDETGNSRSEEYAVAHLRKVLDDSAIELNIVRICVPTFYGTGVAVNVELEQPLSPEAAAEILRQSPGLLLAASGETPGVETLADAVGQDATLVSRVRSDHTVQNGLNLWIAFDNVRKGQAGNAVQIAEILVREYL